MRCYYLSKSTSTVTATTTTANLSGGIQAESAIDRHQQGSFVGLSTTVHTPESTLIPAAERYAWLRLLAEISDSQLQIDPFQALATYQTVSLNDDAQEQSASSLSLPYEPSQAADDTNPIMEVGEHEPRSSQNSADPNADSIDKWIIYCNDETRPFKCGYEGCSRTCIRKQGLRRHIVTHISDSQFRCYTGNCTGVYKYCDKEALARHIYRQHTMKRPYECDICNKRYPYQDNLFRHRIYMHSVRDEQKQPKYSDSTDKWIVHSGDKTKPFRCGYAGCGKTYITKQSLQRHFVKHTGNTLFRCYTGDCTGTVRYFNRQALARHIHREHTMERPFECNICNKRCRRRAHLKNHQKNVHSIENGQTPKKRAKITTETKEKITKN